MAIDPIPPYNPSDYPAPAPLPAFKLVYVIDGKAAMVLNCDAKTAAVVTSNPTIVQVDPAANVQEGMDYDGTNFTIPKL